MDRKHRAAKAIEALVLAVKDANIWANLNTGEQWLYQWIPLTVSKLAAPSQLANTIRDRIKDWREIGIDERQLAGVAVPNRDRRKLVVIGAISAVESILVEAFLFAESLEFLANDLSAEFDSLTPDERTYWLTVDPAIAFGGDEAGLLVRDKFEASAIGRIVAQSAVGAVVPSDQYAWAIDEIFGLEIENGAELGPSVAEHGEGGTGSDKPRNVGGRPEETTPERAEQVVEWWNQFEDDSEPEGYERPRRIRKGSHDDFIAWWEFKGIPDPPESAAEVDKCKRRFRDLNKSKSDKSPTRKRQ